METHQDKHLKAIRRHAKLITACENEFGSNLNSVKNVQVARSVGQPQATRMVALEAVREYGGATHRYVFGEDWGDGVGVVPAMARVMAVCACHVAFEYLGVERD